MKKSNNLDTNLLHKTVPGPEARPVQIHSSNPNISFCDSDIRESLRSRCYSLNQGTWSGWILTLDLNYVAGYTGPLLFLFERTHNYSVENQGLAPWRLRRLGRSKVRSASLVRIFLFFLSWVSKTQPNHWTKRMATTRLAT